MNPLDLITAQMSPDVMVGAVSIFVFLAVAGVTIVVAGSLSANRSVRQRLAASGTLPASEGQAGDNVHASMRRAQLMVEQAARYVLPSDKTNLKRLRQELIRAGFFDPRAAGYYFLSRFVGAALLGAVGLLVLPDQFADRPASFHWMGVVMLAFLGYYLPNFYLSRRIKKRVAEHRDGFPDFLDLLVVCADAGLSTEAAVDRVALELSQAYPSLSTNLSLAAIELRAGGTLFTVLEHLADRLGLDEARSFATLLQQSDEYGTSLTDSLRVYSEDMRHARMSRAEEKANSLPTKMTLPLMLFIFPIILVVVMLPVVVRFGELGF